MTTRTYGYLYDADRRVKDDAANIRGGAGEGTWHSDNMAVA